MAAKRNKIKLKNPANLISAISVLVGSIILSLIIRQNFFLIFLSSFLVYIAAYVFFEKRRRYQEENFEDYEEEETEEAETVKKHHYSKRQSSNFDVVKSAIFSDTIVKEPVEESAPVVEEEDEEEDSWRSMYSQLSESDDSSFEEDYKRYFSTSLPDREEIAKAQSQQPTNKAYRDNNYREETPKNNWIDDTYDAESVDTIVPEVETQPSSDDSAEESEEDEEEGHIFDADHIEAETLEIQNQVNDLIENKEPEDAVLAKSITAKLKFFRKTRKKVEIEEDDSYDETMSSNLQLIDALYTDTDSMESLKEEAPVIDEAEEVDEVDEIVTEEEPAELPQETSISSTLLATLKLADVDATIKNVTVGPAFTRYDIRPRSMSKLNRIVKLESTLENALQVGPVRVVDVGSNRSLAGIEIPNEERDTVSFHDCIASDVFQMNHSNTSCVLGKDVYGETILTDLKNLSHLLIVGNDAGERNQCMHNLIASILSKVGVFHVDFMMIDIEDRELNVYEPIPHMYVPVLNFADDALTELEALEKTIDTRLELFQRNNARDLVSYNAIKSEAPLSRLILFINELSPLMEYDSKRTESLLCNILQKSRSTGIHIVVGTAHPTEDVLTGLMKANITSKICFALENAEDSESILDVTGAEKLLGSGDMLYYPKGYLAPKRLQCASLSYEEVETLIESIL